MDPKQMMNAMAGMKGPLSGKPQEFRPCSACPAPDKCKAAGKCLKGAA